MCFFDQHRFSCGDFKWGYFREHCNKEYRTGETCGMKLINRTIPVAYACKLCEKIAAKERRREKLQSQINGWTACATTLSSTIYISCSQEIQSLTSEISRLDFERQRKFSGDFYDPHTSLQYQAVHPTTFLPPMANTLIRPQSSSLGIHSAYVSQPHKQKTEEIGEGGSSPSESATDGPDRGTICKDRVYKCSRQGCAQYYRYILDLKKHMDNHKPEEDLRHEGHKSDHETIDGSSKPAAEHTVAENSFKQYQKRERKMESHATQDVVKIARISLQCDPVKAEDVQMEAKSQISTRAKPEMALQSSLTFNEEDKRSPSSVDSNPIPHTAKSVKASAVSLHGKRDLHVNVQWQCVSYPIPL